jgi:hypothetical protein
MDLLPNIIFTLFFITTVVIINIIYISYKLFQKIFIYLYILCQVIICNEQ